MSRIFTSRGLQTMKKLVVEMLKIVGEALIIALVAVFIMRFPLVALLIALGWTTTGATTYLWRWWRFNRRDWHICDTAMLVVFSVYGPISLVSLKWNDE